MTLHPFEAVVIGASAGALESLSALLPALPASCPFPVFVVVHVPPDKESLMAGIMRGKCKMQVREAEDKEPIAPGTVYLAPPDYHLLIESRQSLALSSEEPELFSRPSINVLFESAADIYGPGLLGIVCSGANEDGAEGLRHILLAGGQGVVQRPDTAAAADMPHAALVRNPKAQAMSLPDIAALLCRAAGAGPGPEAEKRTQHA